MRDAPILLIASPPRAVLNSTQFFVSSQIKRLVVVVVVAEDAVDNSRALDFKASARLAIYFSSLPLCDYRLHALKTDFRFRFP